MIQVVSTFKFIGRRLQIKSSINAIISLFGLDLKGGAGQLHGFFNGVIVRHIRTLFCFDVHEFTGVPVF